MKIFISSSEMKYLPLLLVLFLVGAGAFLRSQQPREWNKLLESLKAPGDKSSPQPDDLPAGTTAAVQKSGGAEYITPNTTKFVSTSHVVDVPQPVQPSVTPPTTTTGMDTKKTFVPPNPIPAQSDWTWTTPDGKIYKNVIIEKVEADRVTIFFDQGSAVISIVDLSPDAQRLLNFDPVLAAQAMDDRKKTIDSGIAPAPPATQ